MRPLRVYSAEPLCHYSFLFPPVSVRVGFGSIDDGVIVFGWFKKSTMWQLTSLQDFADALNWLEGERLDGHGEAAMVTYLQKATPILRASVDAYEQTVTRLDNLSGGILSHRDSAQRLGPYGHGKNLIQNLQSIGQELRQFFDDLLECSPTTFNDRWQLILSQSQDYVRLMTRLVGDFGNFELLLPTLPGTGEMIRREDIQACLREMYRINTRNLRILELIHGVHRVWQRHPDQQCLAFFEQDWMLNRAVGGMLFEYMVEADPARIEARRQAAIKAQRRYNQYRFWRAAENLRLMANVAYLDGDQRRPFAQRKYVEADLGEISPVTVDVRRMAWALKEVFNNSLSASSLMYSTERGVWVAQPLQRHAVPDPDPAIRIRCEKQTRRQRLGQKTVARLSVLDEGMGIAPEHIDAVTLWAYSPRREAFRARARDKKLSGDRLQQEIQIGGKGIGLAYAAEVFREHGGSLDVQANPEGGTIVTCELPIPTDVKL